MGKVVDDVAENIGRVIGLTRILRTIVQDARSGRVRLPQDQLGPTFSYGGMFEVARAGGSLKQMEGTSMPMMLAEAEKVLQDLPAAVQVLHLIAKDHIKKARSLRGTLPAGAKGASPVFLAAVPADQYLDR